MCVCALCAYIVPYACAFVVVARIRCSHGSLSDLERKGFFLFYPIFLSLMLKECIQPESLLNDNSRTVNLLQMPFLCTVLRCITSNLFRKTFCYVQNQCTFTSMTVVTSAILIISI